MNGVPISAIPTGASRNDVIKSLPLVDAIPPIRGVRGRPPQKPKINYADLGYDSEVYRQRLRERAIKLVIAKRRTERGSGLGRFRWVVGRTSAWLQNFRHLRIRFERRAHIHEAFLNQAATPAGTRCPEPRCAWGTRVAWLPVSYGGIDANPTDAVLMIGATDIFNQSALEAPASPIDGAPVLDVRRAHAVLNSKRDIATGHAGTGNPRHCKEKTRMEFGDTKQNMGGLLRQLEAYGFSK